MASLRIWFDWPALGTIIGLALLLLIALVREAGLS